MFQAALTDACGGALANIQAVVEGTASTPVQTILTGLRVPAPGTVTGRIAFNPSGGKITVARDAYGLGAGCGGGAGSRRGGRSHVVSTLREKFARTRSYTLTFKLNATGRRILARLSAYSKRHPFGQRPPSLSYGVALIYTPAG